MRLCRAWISRIPLLVPIIVLGIDDAARAQQRRPLPAKVDLRPEFARLDLPVRSQGGRDTCSVFAITALAGFEHGRSSPENATPLSEEFLVWAANEATGRTGDQAMFYEAIHGLESLGICDADRLPYSRGRGGIRRPSAAAIEKAKARRRRWRAHWIKRWDLRRDLTEAELVAIKTALVDGHPVACGLRWPRKPDGHELIAIPSPEDVHDGHSIAIVGYQDNAAREGGGVFIFRNSFGPGWGESGHGLISYAYTRTYANDVVWLELGAPRSGVPAFRFEAEDVPVLTRSRCSVSIQSMETRGAPMWSEGRQLLGRAEKGGFVELEFVVEDGGRYRVRVLATAAPDFGMIRVSVNRGRPGPIWDLYSGRVSPSGGLDLGVLDLPTGKHTIRIAAVDRNAASKNFFFGIDAIDLLRAR